MRRDADSTAALALAAERYVTPAVAASLVQRPERTVRDWATGRLRGTVRHCFVDGVLYVDLDDVLTQDHQRSRRRRR